MRRIYKIYRSSTARLLNVSRIVPEDWEEVLVEVVDAGVDYIVLKLTKVV